MHVLLQVQGLGRLLRLDKGVYRVRRHKRGSCWPMLTVPTRRSTEDDRIVKKWLDLNEYVERLHDRPDLFARAKVRFLIQVGRFGILLVKADR